MITWTIASMESQPATGIVISANWYCIGEDSGCTASLSGTCVFPIPEGGYVPYEQLTKDQVLQWVWTDGGVDQITTEASVNNALQAQVNPPVVQQPLPWESA
ncbi:hypothetical protein A4F89_06610 [Polynucleobacter asymbioticus]|jgi:hypothetical protein|uniref:DUF7936 family protein n=1 Tax=Polynucleobacter asymbioticus TaxID=576611 RepID=UPI0008FAFA7A|nr:hypothetical protein [Polynucleobacter asymbioticus]APB99020.1 hypothetical protein A4F89_06610 [Polynucleobacter asymbioticus]